LQKRFVWREIEFSAINFVFGCMRNHFVWREFHFRAKQSSIVIKLPSQFGSENA